MTRSKRYSMLMLFKFSLNIILRADCENKWMYVPTCGVLDVCMYNAYIYYIVIINSHNPECFTHTHTHVCMVCTLKMHNHFL